MGKSETAKMFASLGVPLYDADAVVHALYDKGGAAVASIAAAFPDVVIDGRVDRPRLGELVRADAAAFKTLETIVHPLTTQARADFVAAQAARGADLVVLDIPLLFEIGADKEMDAIVVVSAPAHIQHVRVMARPGMTVERLEALKARQVPDAQKRAQADFVVETDKGLEHALAAVKDIVAQVRGRR